MAWGTFANPRESFVLGDAQSSRAGQISRKTWGFRLVAMAHFGVLALAATGVVQISIQSFGILTAVLLCAALVMQGRNPNAVVDETPEPQVQKDSSHPEDEARTPYALDNPTTVRTLLSQNNTPGEAWTDLASRVSHELRTPLNAVIGFSDLMERELHGPLGSPQYSEYTRHIRSSGQALLKSAEDTLAMTSALARADDDKALLETTSFHDVAKSAWAFLEEDAAERGITLTIHASSDCLIEGDRITYRQVLLNMLSDVIKSSLNDGRIILSARQVYNQIEIEILATSVSDSLPCEDTLDLCLARALLDVQRLPLKVVHQPLGTRRLLTYFHASTQKELF